MSKEQILEEAITEIKLQGEHSTNDYKFIKATISKAIDQTREETLADSDLRVFGTSVIKDGKRISPEELYLPYDVSQWKEIGKLRGYWNYFKDEIREETIREVEEIIPDFSSDISGDWADGYNQYRIELLRNMKEKLIMKLLTINKH